MMIVNVIFGTNNGVAEATAPEAGALAAASTSEPPYSATHATPKRRLILAARPRL